MKKIATPTRVAMRRGSGRCAWKRLTKAGMVNGSHNTQNSHKK
jgi:hypothetical protein